MTAHNALELGQTTSARSYRPTVPLACGKTLHYGFFFDGFRRNLEADLRENRTSNIGRLFLAHQFDSPNASVDVFNAYRKVYLSGLGAKFDTAIGELSGEMPLRTIKISVFGFDFGATLARAFVYTLLERSRQSGDALVYRNARLEIVFAGLFDAVDRTAASVPLLEFFLPTTNRIDDGGLVPVPVQVKSVLHLGAAHERRFYRRARLLGSARRGWREELMPGVSEDIGGGLAPGEQKPSNELALVSLHRMYRAASHAGAAFPALDGLAEKDVNVAELFVYNDHTPAGHSVSGLALRYQRWVGHRQPGHEAFLHHMRYYIRWLASRWQAYRLELNALAEREEELHQGPFGRSSTLTQLLGRGTETQDQRQQRIDQLHKIQQRRRELETSSRWLREVDAEARDMRTRLRANGAQAVPHRQALEVWLVLLAEWFEPQPLEAEIAELFEHFVHDMLVPTPMQRMGSTWFGGENFFTIRGFDRPNEKRSTAWQPSLETC
ncbi:DUF2235 domain-containing protein [Halopseudomonas pertucinogena]|nr:DUF2235 domain-containing protein [Halopseudomonas pertucinogena]